MNVLITLVLLPLWDHLGAHVMLLFGAYVAFDEPEFNPFVYTIALGGDTWQRWDNNYYCVCERSRACTSNVGHR